MAKTKADLPEVHCVSLTRSEVADLRAKIEAREDHDQWKKMSDLEREALLALVSDGLERLSRHPEEWLPNNLQLQPDGRVGMFILWTWDRVNTEVVVRRRRASQRDKDRLTELRRMAGLEEEPDSSAS